jgi:hypothetical protein
MFTVSPISGQPTRQYGVPPVTSTATPRRTGREPPGDRFPGVADATVDNLIRKVNQLVVEHTGLVSITLPELSNEHRELLEPLADNLDVPARLGDGPWLTSTFAIVPNPCAGRRSGDEIRRRPGYRSAGQGAGSRLRARVDAYHRG